MAIWIILNVSMELMRI